MITATIVGAERVERRFTLAGDIVRERLRKEMNFLGEKLLRGVKQTRLTGQSLNVRTGRLRRSINFKFSETYDSMNGSVGTNVVYGRFWEIGFKGVQNIRAHIRRMERRSTYKIKTTKSGKHAQASQGIAFVRGHTRNVDQKARPFLVPELEEMRAEIRRRLFGVVGGI